MIRRHSVNCLNAYQYTIYIVRDKLYWDSKKNSIVL